MSLLLAFGGAGPSADDPNTRLSLFDVLDQEDDDHAFYAFLAAIVEEVADDSETRILAEDVWWLVPDEYDVEFLLADPVEDSVEHLLFTDHAGERFDDLELHEYAHVGDPWALPEESIEHLLDVLPYHEIEPDDGFGEWLEAIVEDVSEWIVRARRRDRRR